MAFDVPTLIDLNSYTDSRGFLGIVQGFVFRRMYYISDGYPGVIRGEHAHKSLEQVFIVVKGSATLELYDSKSWNFFNLREKSSALYVPPGYWRRVKLESPDTVLIVLASEIYDVNDYIYSIEEFLAWKGDNYEYPIL